MDSYSRVLLLVAVLLLGVATYVVAPFVLNWDASSYSFAGWGEPDTVREFLDKQTVYARIAMYFFVGIAIGMASMGNPLLLVLNIFAFAYVGGGHLQELHRYFLSENAVVYKAITVADMWKYLLSITFGTEIPNPAFMQLETEPVEKFNWGFKTGIYSGIGGNIAAVIGRLFIRN